jgi:hypothetical protein
MPILVTETFSAIAAGGRMARKSFRVTGTADPILACAQAGIPQINTAFSATTYGVRLLCEGPIAFNNGHPQDWRVECTFTPPPTGSNHTATSANPLTQDVEFWEEPVEISVSRDLDLDGRPVISSSGNPAEPMPLTVHAVRIHYEKYYNTWDNTWIDSYKGAENDAPVVLLGKTYDTYHVLCEQCEKVGKYKITSVWVKVHWAFLCLPQSILGPRPHQYRFMDADTVGNDYVNGTDGTKVKRPFCAGGEAVSKPVRLNGSGLPLACNGEIKVSRVTNPTADPKDHVIVFDDPVSPDQAPTYLATQNYSEGEPAVVVARWNILRRVKTVSFAGIPL